jgi:hypothetical protein
MLENRILFYGDSFTWGQNLYFYDWIEKNRISDELLNYRSKDLNKGDTPNIFQWAAHWDLVDDESTAFRSKHRTSALLSDKLGEEWLCVNYISNGGNNTDSFGSIYKDSTVNLQPWKQTELGKRSYISNPNKVLVVLQLTHTGRDYEGPRGDMRSDGPNWKHESAHILQTIDKVDGIHEKLKEQGKHLLVWSWPGDLGWLIRKKPYSCGIRIGDEVFNSFDEAQLYSSCYDTNFCYDNQFKKREVEGDNNDFRNHKDFVPKHDIPITIRQSLGCIDSKYLGVGDDHPSREFHQVMADSIYYKMKDMDLI